MEPSAIARKVFAVFCTVGVMIVNDPEPNGIEVPTADPAIPPAILAGIEASTLPVAEPATAPQLKFVPKGCPVTTLPAN